MFTRALYLIVTVYSTYLTPHSFQMAAVNLGSKLPRPVRWVVGLSPFLCDMTTGGFGSLWLVKQAKVSGPRHKSHFTCKALQ